MRNIKTPGVYIQEISKLPASVAPVATAIPAFVGYTEKRIKDREELPLNTPVAISSLLEYEQIFGTAFNEDFGATLTGDPLNAEETSVAITGLDDISPYLMYYAIRMFFANGGGRCYVVSVGDYDDDIEAGDAENAEGLLGGIAALESEDEPTILVVPEAVQLGGPQRGGLYDAMLEQCSDLKDRFALMDVSVSESGSFADANNFRDEIGMSSLNYGAAYYPSLKTLLNYQFEEQSVAITDQRSGDGVGPKHRLHLPEISEGSTFARGKIVILENDEIEVGDIFTIGGDDYEVVAIDPGTGQFELAGGENTTAQHLANAILDSAAYSMNRITNTSVILVTATEPGEDGEAITMSFSGSDTAVSIDENLSLSAPDKALYNKIKKELDKRKVTLYPSAAIAGVYASVDRNRGVWKAPANVSLNFVSEPSVLVTDEEQAPLNVDPNTGKSVNVIRKFHQKGNIVWGARTLAGNNNEWRYVPVRRLFIFIEESIKKATEPVVFEPNDANTWSKMKAMIENFLAGLWRDGALAGATPDDAFFVNVGLGETMSAIDILEGRLIIEVGIAAVRPAEFIILRFMHKLQES